jgi:outer membrane protein insertion porin family
LSPVHPITHIDFMGVSGAAGIDQDALRRAIADRYGATPPLTRAPDIARLVETALSERGYLHASATSTSQIEHAPERASLTLAIEPRTRTTIGNVTVTGHPTVSRDELLRRLGLTAGAPLLRDRLDANIERYVADRRTRGYYEARIVPVITLTDDDRVADVLLDVIPGSHFRVVFTGDDVPAGKRDEFVPVEREGSADEDLLEDSSNRIEDYFREQGYRNASAPHSRNEEEGDLVIAFAVTRGPLYRVQTYEITGNTAIPVQDFASSLKIHVDQPFVDSRLDADVAMIDSLYHRRGFASAKARAAFEPQTSAATSSFVPVTVRIVVTEGVRTVVDRVSIEGGSSAVDPAALRAKLHLQTGSAYVASDVTNDRDTVLLAYQDEGYQNASVEIVPEFTADQRGAAITYRVQPGARIYVDHVLIVGNIRTKPETIERELQFKTGAPYSLSAINDSQRRLASLGLFRRVRISELRHGSETERDLLVSVEEAPPTTIGYGFGAEGRRIAETNPNGTTTERFDVAPRASFEIGRRNLFGKNRSVNLFTSISRSFISITEYRVVATLREPRLFDTAADGFINGTLEQQHRSTFDFARKSLSANVERRFPGPYRITGSYQLQRTNVFNLTIDKTDPNFPLIDRAFPNFRLSSFSGSLIRDTRDDALETHDGTYVSANGQLAAQAIGSEVGFIKSFFTAQLFKSVPHTRGFVFAGSARLGLATGFTDVQLVAPDASATTQGELPASERFFAGGDSTVRGFALDQLGVRHFPPQPGDTIDQDGVAIGGNGLVIFNAELRVPVAGGLGVVGFLDTGNVYARVSDIDLAEVRSAIGGGIRYRSPVGPLRIDVGMKLNRLPGESRGAWFISFGQAF